jgi:protease I
MAKIAFIVGQEFEDSEFRVPYDLLRTEHEVTVLGVEQGEALHGHKHNEVITPDATLRDHPPSEYDALVIPGGYSPDHLRMKPEVVSFVREFGKTHKPIAAVCHGPSLLVDAELLQGKRVTSWTSVRKDLENAGATWVDSEVVHDGNLITSRGPADLGAFSKEILRTLEA